MKKITLSIATIAIAMSSYSQNWEIDNTTIQENHKEIEYRIQDLIDAITMDVYYGHLEKARGMYYIKEIIKIKSINRDVMTDTWNYYQVIAEHLPQCNHYNEYIESCTCIIYNAKE
tara:strand:- start:108 stop:455 length:348 start_codon:yes stop_codon:yes gene_type:complete